jgi:hypothetical protein
MKLRWPLIGRPPRVTLYSRDNCSLCVEAQRTVTDVFGRDRVDVVDIVGNRKLEDAFVFRVPVLVVGGVVLAEGRITMRDARRARRTSIALRRRGDQA